MAKVHNEYAMAVGAELYAAIPKAVWAAIAVSALTVGGDEIEAAKERVLHEWRVLHSNGVVPQSPPS